MSGGFVLIVSGLTGLLLFAAAWELVGLDLPRPGRKGFGPLTSFIRGLTTADEAGDRWARRFDVAARLERAGLAARITPRSFLAIKVLTAALGTVTVFLVLPVAPGRLLPILVPGLVIAGFLGPDAWAERRARRRRAAIARALPDTLDLLAVGAAAGRPPVSLFLEIASAGAGPLAAELATALAEIETGAPQKQALERMRSRTGAVELSALAAALERSRRFGSPLADQLYVQASELRRAERRQIAERAARAAPKIQLVIALVLVPSALLTIAAAIVAHSEALFSAL